MAFDEVLAERVRLALGRQQAECDERRMFGGLAFLVRGHMCCGVLRDELIVRVGAERFAAALAEPHARVMDFTGRPSTGMVYVSAAGVADDAALRSWVARGLAFTASLPARNAVPTRAKRAPLRRKA